ncbi:hypothetical protein GYH30_003758 [Glycine max]|uniref:Replication protein A 70 kDa DNA-binding subunit B/D first OB fold domain-containing protein n=1 Tax=Glycine max TaxID=3847 RepID=A0A0R0KVY6_SOYBN|nr:hypothetical protein GYH30_003758 [Glycine max]
MAKKYNSIAEINAEKESWRIMVRIARLWMVSDVSINKQTSSNKIPFSMEMVLMDSKGDRVHGSIKRTLIYKFDKTLQEEKVNSIQFFGVVRNYKTVFQYSIKVALVDNASVPNSLYNFVPIRDIVCGGYDTDYLLGKIQHKCTLFGPFVDELNAFLASGVVKNVVIIVHLAKVKCFQYKIHLQNCICGTRVVSNAECEEVKELATRMFESPSQGLSQMTDSTALSMSKDFLHNTIRKTIGGLKDCFEVFGIVKHVLDNEEWWYTTCTCNKLVYHVSKMYRIKVRVIDESDSVTFVIFERDATILFYKPSRKNMEDADKQLEGLQFENVKTNENSRLKGKTNIVEPMQSQSLEMHLPLKSFKKRIKVEKI